MHQHELRTVILSLLYTIIHPSLFGLSSGAQPELRGNKSKCDAIEKTK